ncbi:MAG: BBP7 family outer membrane beta-barrel protein, partial [Gemmataceae bacterium]|nr:BBP7 family outer membrane beta-barrel protein [Gemmataceae bacterium]
MSIRYAAALALGLGVVPAAVAQSEINWKPVGSKAPAALASQAQPSKSAAPVVVPAVPAPTGLATSTAFPDPTGTCCPDVCCPGGRVWTSAEWLYWTTSGQSLPPLAAASVPGTPRGAAGVAGVPTTFPLFGTDRVNNDFRSGFRLNAGVWLNDRHTWGLEGDFFFLGQSRDSFTGSTLDNPILARPFFNAATGLADAQLVSFPGALR